MTKFKCVLGLNLLNPKYLSNTWQHLGKGEKSGVVGYEAGSEQQCSVLFVEVSQLLFQFYVKLTGPRDVPCASCP